MKVTDFYIPGMPTWQNDLKDITVFIDSQEKQTFSFGEKVNRFNRTGIEVKVNM